MSMLKWKLMITTLPVPVAAVIVRWILEHFFKNYMNNYSGVMDFSALAPVLTGGVFLIGLMLSGTLQDYKESEKIPAELATSLETIEESIGWVCANRPQVNERQMRDILMEVTDELIAWLYRKRSHEQMFIVIEKLNLLLKEFDKLGANLPSVRMTTEIHNLRRTVTRIGVISRTGFLASGYALLDLLVVSVLTLLVVASYKSEFGTLGKYIIIGFVSLIYSYLWRLVRDVDDPFEYSPDGERTGAAEVELFPLTEYQARARDRLAGKTLEERYASAQDPDEEKPDAAPSPALLIGVGVGCLFIGAFVVWLVSRSIGPQGSSAGVTPVPATSAPVRKVEEGAPKQPADKPGEEAAQPGKDEKNDKDEKSDKGTAQNPATAPADKPSSDSAPVRIASPKEDDSDAASDPPKKKRHHHRHKKEE